MPKGEFYSLNHHDCIELILPIEGLCLESFSEAEFNLYKIFKIGQQVKHGFNALEDFEFISVLVKFKNNETTN